MSVIRFLAIKILPVPPEDVIGREMQKNLKEGEIYNFFDDVHIDENKIVVPSEINLYDIKIREKNVSINISALVGENGSGKSTLVDYALRLLNNFSTFVFGEYYRTPGAEHLHYVFNVYAELFIQIGALIFEIHCEGDKLIVYKYKQSESDSHTYERNTASRLVKERLDPSEIIEENLDLRNYLKDFCYTMITNYSLYSLCAVNYKNENTQYQKENRIRKLGQKDGYKTKTLSELRNDAKARKGSMTSYYDAQSWLQGLFAKNDGYQVPVNITPMRNYGRIDIQKEFKLAKERMLSLVFVRNEDGKHNFSIINGKLLIDAISISKDFNEEQKYTNIDWINNYLSSLDRNLQRDIIGIIRQSVCSNCRIQEDKRDHSELVWNYIVKKILKIVFTYPQYVKQRHVLLNLKSKYWELNMVIDGIVKEVLHDHSHVTRKLFRSIYYLKYEHINKKKYLKIEEFGSTIDKLVREEKDKSPMCPQYIDELLPPPIFYVDFDLYDINDEQKHNKIKFSTLSSGEKQITYTLSSFFYQLINIDSSGDIRMEQKDTFLIGYKTTEPGQTTYKHVCAIFDEIELYYHPEMQRLFVQTLLDGLKQLDFRQIEGLHIVMATHSPFILSDIPVQNVLFLGKDGKPKRMKDFCAFGANIHSMLRHSFFLENGSMGEFARNTIRQAQNTMNRYLIWHEVEIIMNNFYITSDLRDERIEYLKECKRKQLSYLPKDIFEQWIDRNDVYEMENESKDLLWVSKIIEIIQEPIIKTIMSEQLNKWRSYVAIRD